MSSRHTSVISTPLTGMMIVGTNSVMPSAGDRLFRLRLEYRQPATTITTVTASTHRSTTRCCTPAARGCKIPENMSKLKCVCRHEQMAAPRKTHHMKAKSESSSPHRKDALKKYRMQTWMNTPIVMNPSRAARIGLSQSSRWAKSLSTRRAPDRRLEIGRGRHREVHWSNGPRDGRARHSGEREH
jgi:hypothetical protein